MQIDPQEIWRLTEFSRSHSCRRVAIPKADANPFGVRNPIVLTLAPSADRSIFAADSAMQVLVDSLSRAQTTKLPLALGCASDHNAIYNQVLWLEPMLFRDPLPWRRDVRT